MGWLGWGFGVGVEGKGVGALDGWRVEEGAGEFGVVVGLVWGQWGLGFFFLLNFLESALFSC